MTKYTNAQYLFGSRLRLLQTVQVLFLVGVLISRDITVQLIFLAGGVLFMTLAYFFSEEYRMDFKSKIAQKLVVLLIVLIAGVYLYLTRDHSIP